jgi:hypothetical protein
MRVHIGHLIRFVQCSTTRACISPCWAIASGALRVGVRVDSCCSEVQLSAEQQFRNKAREAGWLVTKRGWPDFFCWGPAGEIIAVEVKRYSVEPFRMNQGSLLQILADHGIPAYRWDPFRGFQRIKPQQQA